MKAIKPIPMIQSTTESEEIIDKRIFLSEEHRNSDPSYPTISDTNRVTWVESGNDSTLHRWKDELLWVIEIKKSFCWTNVEGHTA